MKFNLNQLDELKQKAVRKEKKVRDMVVKIDKKVKNIYENISGHENETNYILYDLGRDITGLERHVISITELFSGKVNGEDKMTTGHLHQQEEVYIFLKGKGKIVLGEDTQRNYAVSVGDVITIPPNVWHRVINTDSRENLEFLCIFETYEGRG